MTAPTSAEHGAKAVRDRVVALLIADLPARIDLHCELWALPEASLPKPDMVTSGEVSNNLLDQRGDVWIEVITPKVLPRTKLAGLTAPGGNMVYRFRYAARIYVWVKTEHWSEAMNRRDRLMFAARACLLDYPTLAIPPASGDTGFLIYPDTLAEEAPAPFRIPKNPRVWAGGVLLYECEEEYEMGIPTTRPDDGPYTGIDLAVTLLPYTIPDEE